MYIYRPIEKDKIIACGTITQMYQKGGKQWIMKSSSVLLPLYLFS